MKKILLVFMTWGIFAFSMFSQGNNLPASVVRAIQGGDSHALAEGFNDNIELILPSQSGVFSKSQAEYIMADFFRKNPPSGFNIIHQSQKESSSFAIGKYTASNGSYRFSFLSKSDGRSILIIQLRIEKQDE